MSEGGKSFSYRLISIKEANEFVIAHHRHNKQVLASRFNLALYFNNELIGVAIVGNTLARAYNQDGVGEIRRLCVIEGAPKNSCSYLYGACWREWRKREFGVSKTRGWKLYTYTLQKENGASLRASNFKVDGYTKGHKGWNTKKRKRESQPVYSEPKVRWVIYTEKNARPKAVP